MINYNQTFGFIVIMVSFSPFLSGQGAILSISDADSRWTQHENQRVDPAQIYFIDHGNYVISETLDCHDTTNAAHTMDKHAIENPNPPQNARRNIITVSLITDASKLALT